MGHVRDRWTSPGVNGRRVHNDRWGKGKRWQARWVDRGGDEHAQTFATRDAADMHLRQVDTSVPVFEARGLTFGTYTERWRAEQLHWRPQTARTVDQFMRSMIVPALGSVELTEMTRSDVQSAVTDWASRYSVSRTKIAYGFVASVYKHAIANRLVEFTPCTRISLPADHRVRVMPMSAGQVSQIRDNIADHYRHAVELDASTGLRGGEWRGITLDRIDLDKRTLRIDRQLIGMEAGQPVFGPPKTKAGERTLELPDPAVTAIKTQLRDYPVTNEWGLLFMTRQGNPVSRGDAANVFSSAIDGLGLPPRTGWHALRHYCASLLIAAGLSPTAVADWLGHQDATETLQTYAHLWPTDHARIVAVLNSDQNPFSEKIDGPDTDQ